MRNIDWAAVARRMAAIHDDRIMPREEPFDDNLPSLSVEDLSAQLARGEGVQVVDARPRHYFSKATDMMQGAIWRDPEQVDEWVGKLAPDRPVAVYCAYGFHVGRGVTSALRERGFDARYVAGGLSAWYGMGGARALPSGAD
jgi:Fe-Mn family superoxide dismutase